MFVFNSWQRLRMFDAGISFKGSTILGINEDTDLQVINIQIN